MPSKHNRQYDLVVFGATGYTGKFTAEHIATSLPTDLKWAIAGRSQGKLEKLAVELKKINPDRRQPDIEICDLYEAELNSLAKKTFILITTVGPYGIYGEYAFKACADNGTHYLDVTGEVPFVARMIKNYETTAKQSGAMLFPEVGLESAPPDLMTWLLAKRLRTELSAKTRDVNISVALKGKPSGGTLASVLEIFDTFTLKEFADCLKPYALSPVPRLNAPSQQRSIRSIITGLRTVPSLGLLTTFLAGDSDAAIVGRTWGLFSQIPSRKDQFYGPNFTFAEGMKVRNWLSGIAVHWSLALFSVLLVALPSLRKIAKYFVYKQGEGPDLEEAKKETAEYKGVANPDVTGAVKMQAFCRALWQGSIYSLTGLLLAHAAATILEDELELDGGVYTAACLGQGFVDRLDGGGFRFETKTIIL